MKFSTTLAMASMAALAVAVPTATVEKRADTCGQYDSVTTGTYIVYNDLWGESGATSGSGCIGVDGLSGTTVKWHAT
jgi:xyloglucan-specific endo-beta-1,4-glucanase